MQALGDDDEEAGRQKAGGKRRGAIGKPVPTFMD
jgi:hypothetical protein